MPVTYGTFQKSLKLLPLTLHESGNASITVRYGFVEDKDGAEFIATSSETISIDAKDVSEILDVPGIPGLSRRDDLSLAVYQFLVARKYIPEGTVS